MPDKISVIYKDKNFLALYKPAGVLVHQTLFKNSKNSTVVDWLLKNYPEVKEVGDDRKIRPGIVHRLDKDTSGVMVVPRNQHYFEYLKKLFSGKAGPASGRPPAIKKNYLALVYGELKPRVGKIEKPISLKSGSVKRTVWKGKMEKRAITEYKVIRYFASGYSLVEVEPHTGRTHQIRIHLSSLGHPVVGDSLYGPKKNPFGLARQFLHAESLEWTHEGGKRIKIESELPEELQGIIDELEKKG